MNFVQFSICFVLILFVKQADLFKLPNIANGTDDINLEIVNGHITKHGDFPYQVSLFVATDKPRKGYGIICGGVIMNQNWIVTAAHCTVDKDTGEVYKPSIVNVRVGIDELSGDPNLSRNTHIAAEIYPHPNYRDNGHFADVALIKIRDEISFSNDIKAACFDYSEKKYNYLIVSGYGKVTSPIKELDGKTDIRSGKQGNELKYAYVKEDRNADFCDGMTKVCVVPYYENSGDSSCNGDSGGPISTPDKRVMGVFSTIHASRTSDGNAWNWCVGKSQYMRLSRFKNDFIDKHVGSNNYCWNN